MLHDNNLIEMSLRFNRPEPLFRTLRELPGIGNRPRIRDDIRLQRNLPITYTLKKTKLGTHMPEHSRIEISKLISNSSIQVIKF